MKHLSLTPLSLVCFTTALLICFLFHSTETKSDERKTCFHHDKICYLTLEDNKSAHISAQNNYAFPMRISLHITGQNITPALKTENVLLGSKEIKSIISIQAKSHGEWRYNWTSQLHPETDGAKHDDTVLYEFPFPKTKSYPISQGPNGTFSHTGPNSFAIDWAMPVGSEILAAREGIVIALREDSSRGGASNQYKSEENYLWIKHVDGTIGQYLHLKKDGAVVKVGDKVEKGQLIAYSGNTGYSTAPHLHFHVSSSQPHGAAFKSHPINFAPR
ncbi:M23 family metallopeptidase [Kiloniella sp. EL199]|uniref:M23 family metallopeptidase n=1 Tax=Kiloniella sp. EL199 TaxID=2107581 RepID=UPI000EA2E2A1|nr:M23 family metallopeptidase [Kiloniella sp. EL199]